MADYPPGGILNEDTDKQNDRSPDYWGNLEIDEKVFRFICEEYKAKRKLEFRVVGWRKQGRKGGFISILASVPQQRNDDRRDNRRDEPRRDPPPRRDDRRDDRRSSRDDEDSIPF